MFDRHARLTGRQVAEVVNLAKAPRFTEKSVGIEISERLITFFVEPGLSGIERDCAMIESGMAQQAVGLVCAALGVGMVFNNLGEGGMQISASRFGTVRIRIDAMKPGYGDSDWTNSAPDGIKPWKSGTFRNRQEMEGLRSFRFWRMFRRKTGVPRRFPICISTKPYGPQKGERLTCISPGPGE